MYNISIYGSHNATYVVWDVYRGKVLLVLELERFLGSKNIGLAQYLTPKAELIEFYAQQIPKWIMQKYGINEFENCYYLNSDVIMDGKIYHLQNHIPAKNYIQGKHHESHAACCFYQSPYNEALVVSFDGGGNDGKFNIYHATREGSIQLLKRVYNTSISHENVDFDLGFPYMIFGHYLADIKQEPLNIGNLVYPGKLMGLASYGYVIEDWVPYFVDFYLSNPDGTNYKEKISILGSKIGVKFDEHERIISNEAWNIATTSQYVFEQLFIAELARFVSKYPNLPICVTGGCGLNIILNTKLVEEYNLDVFVGPNPNDCGIALGLLLHQHRPTFPVDITYSGTKLLDIDSLFTHINNNGSKAEAVDIRQIAKDLVIGNIIGVARGRAEHGPRALGNRSILCAPFTREMKTLINNKIKHREWYRPFAPVVRLEDVSEYFEWEKESRHMSFCPKVKEEYAQKLLAITHVDGTARVQTVTREQNEFLYDLLTEFKEQTGIGVLLNTSFNVDGKPILSTISEAFDVLYNTGMHAIIIEGTYIKK